MPIKKNKRDQRELEEDVEQDDVAGDEDAQHAGFQDQQQTIVERRPARSIASQPTSTATTISSAVSPNSHRLRPSMATLKRMSIGAPLPPSQGRSVAANGSIPPG